VGIQSGRRKGGHRSWKGKKGDYNMRDHGKGIGRQQYEGSWKGNRETTI
jgi:hypothetical protein